jgi:hypothetical protein
VPHHSSKSLGPFHKWANEAAELLRESERRLRHSLPRGEIISRGLQKLSRQQVIDMDHLRRLVPFVAKQVIFDWNRERQREEARWAPDDVDGLVIENPAVPDWIRDRLDLLLGPDSPLDEGERYLLRAVLESPEQFMNPKGHPRQSALGPRLGVDQKTIFNWWAQIRRKAAALDRRAPVIPPPSI